MDVHLKEGNSDYASFNPRTIAQYHFKQLGIVPLSYQPYQSQSSVDLSSWMLKGSIPNPISTLRWSHFHTTPQQSVRPQVDLDPDGFTTPPRTIYVPKLSNLTMCSSLLAWPPPCRSFRSDEDPTSSPYAILLVWTSSLCQGLLQIVHHLFLHQPVCTNLWTSQQLLIPEKPWNSISMDFIEKLPHSSGLHSILVMFDCLSKHVTLHPDSRYHYITSTCTNSSFYMSFPSTVSPSHITSDRGMEFISHFFQSLRTALDMKLHFTSGYHPKGDDNRQMNQTEQYLQVYCNYQQDNCLNSFH